MNNYLPDVFRSRDLPVLRSVAGDAERALRFWNSRVWEHARCLLASALALVQPGLYSRTSLRAARGSLEAERKAAPHSVEAWPAAEICRIHGVMSSNSAFDEPGTKEEALAAAMPFLA